MKYENADSKVQHFLDYAKETWIMDYLLAKKIYGLQASLKLVNKMSLSDASLLNMEKIQILHGHNWYQEQELSEDGSCWLNSSEGS